MGQYTGFVDKDIASVVFIEHAPSRLALMRTFSRNINDLKKEFDHTDNILLSLSRSLEAKDPPTKEHSLRVSKISTDFASFLGLSQKMSEDVRRAGIIHDIGKIFLSTSLLRKPGILTEDEKDEVKSNVVLGEEICKPLISMRRILPAIRNHHERWDGRGFPDGLQGEDIPVIARILAIADSFDAIASERCYSGWKSARGTLEAMKSEQHYGQWDPELLDYFLEMMSLAGEGIYNLND
jgi:putative two-component system response regulator